MRATAALLLLALATVSPEVRYFRYQRAVQNLPAQPGQACLVVDPQIFAHAQPGLADLRLYQGAAETPYIVRNAAPVVAAQGSIEPLNKGERGGQTGFDLEMPEGHYSDLDLAIGAHDFIATVQVAGSQTQSGAETKLGEYTIFDLSKQRLGRSTVLHLPEADFKYLHIKISAPIKPDEVTAISAVRLPSSEPRYITVAQTAQTTRNGHTTVIEFTVAPHVPVDRVAFVVAAQPAQFSRNVTIQDEPIQPAPPADAPRYPQIVSGSGSLLRVHSVEDGHRIDEERLTLDAPQADFNTPAHWTVAIDNGDDAPLSIIQVRLEMLERDLCFDAAAGAAYTLFYGDAPLPSPRYDYASLFVRQKDAAKVVAGPEQPNPAYEPRPDQRPFTERHPALLWIVLVVVIAVLGVVALGSVRQAS